MLRTKKKNENGVTLVTLVITIIVLLILAGVSLNGLFGDSGIIGNALKSKENSEIRQEKELIQVASVHVIAQSKTGEITVDEMQKSMGESIRTREGHSNR